MYYRIYPNKSTTIFKKQSGGFDVSNGNINTGANPISEIMNGDGKSTFIMGFDISSLVSKLQNYTYTCNLQVFDAGVLFEPALTPTDIDVLYFTDEFTEGDGFSFLEGQAIVGYANWNNRTALQPWNDTLTVGNMHAFTMNKTNEDWTIPVTSFVQDAVTNTLNPNFGLRVALEVTAKGYLKLTGGSGGDQITGLTVNGVQIINAAISFNTDLATTAQDIVNNINAYTSAPNYLASIDPLDSTKIIIESDPANKLGSDANGYIIIPVTTFTYTTAALSGGVDSAYQFTAQQTQTKFVHTRHTRTIFQPYLEFFIDEEVIDGRYNAIAGQNIDLYLLNDLGTNLVGTVTAQIKDAEGNVVSTPTVNNPNPGVYYITYASSVTDLGPFFDVWSINGIEVAKIPFIIKSPNQILTNNRTNNLFFYPVTNYVHQSIRKGDIAAFNLISEQRGKGSVIKTGYEYRIVTTSNFEMVPWTSVNVYNNRMYFNVDTNFFYPDIEYEVFVRLVEGGTIKTSNLTYKFRLIDDEPSHLLNKNASPYNERDYYLKK